MSLILDKPVHILKPKQTIFIFAPEQDVIFVGGIGTLKTSSLIKRAMVLSQESPHNLGVIVRKNFVDLRDSTIRDFELETGLEVSKDTKEAHLDNGSVVMFRHGDELPALKNLNLGWFAIEQGEELADSTAWDMLQMRLRRQVKRRSGFMIANANGHNWIYNQFINCNQLPANTRVIQATTLEFKDIHPTDYFERLKNLPKKLYNRYVLNSHEEAEGLVYDEFVEAIHVVEPFSIPETWEKGFVLDHGFRNPTAVLWYALDYDGNVIIYDEHYESEMPISNHAVEIKARGIYDGIADPSIFSNTMQKNGLVYSVADEYRECGITLSPALRSKEDASIARVNEFFKANRIRIFRNNQNTIQEIGNWKWKEIKPGINAKEEPQDLNNHACLSGDTEVITSSGVKKLADIEGNSGSIYTPLGMKDYFCFETGIKECIKLTFDDGFEIVGTQDHTLLTTQGWDRIDYIKEGDILYGTDNNFKDYSRISWQALLLGWYSILPKCREEEIYDFASSGCVGIPLWNNSRQYARSPQRREQVKQFSNQFRDFESIGTCIAPYDFRGKKAKGSELFEESDYIGSYLASFQRGASVALNACQRNDKNHRNISMPLLSETIWKQRQEKNRIKILRSELSEKVLQEDWKPIRLVRKEKVKNQKVYNLFVQDSHSFYLKNSIISHNCDALKYLVASRFSGPVMKEPGPARYSLDWANKLAESQRPKRRF